MSAQELATTVDRHCRKRTIPVSPPTSMQWEALSSRFATSFAPEFVAFHELFARYHIDGGWLGVAPGLDVLSDAITDAYTFEHESAERRWDADLIPIYDLGNGDYYCLRASEEAKSAVYFIRHEDDTIERVAPSFAEWIANPAHFT